MKVLTIFGTRPEIIRLSQIIRQLDRFCDHVLCHTGQNYDENLSDVFFRELGVRQPDFHLGVRSGDFANQVSEIIQRTGPLLDQVRPDRVLILGDTNSGLAAIVAARKGIPVYHLEAGNRCYDDRVPEEINRRIIDHSTTVFMPYTHRSKENLVREGIEHDRIFVVGNPIYEVLSHFEGQIDSSSVLSRLGLRSREFFLVTLHRAENVDLPERLEGIMKGLEQVADRYALPVVVSLHPRTADRIQRQGLVLDPGKFKLMAPLGFFDFVKLEKEARCVLSDSGTVQEECAIFGIPNVTVRDVTERAETVECGSNILSGGEPGEISRAVEVALGTPTSWQPPAEYVADHVSTAVTKIVLGYRHAR